MENLSNSRFRPIGPCPYLCPVPAVLLGCANPEKSAVPNLITVAWTGIVCSKPPMVSVSLRKSRYSYTLIRDTGEFTLNLVGRSLCRAMDFCGVKSGKELDKFKALNLHAIPAPGLAKAPALAEAPAFLCCKVRALTPLGSHDLFVAEIMEVCIGEQYFAPDGSIQEEKMDLVSYVHGKYRALAPETLGFFGYSVASPEALVRRGMHT